MLISLPRPLFPRQGRTINAANKLPATVPDTRSGGFSTPVLPFFLSFIAFSFFVFSTLFLWSCSHLSFCFLLFCPPCIQFSVQFSSVFRPLPLNFTLFQLHKILLFHNSPATNIIFLFLFWIAVNCVVMISVVHCQPNLFSTWWVRLG